MVYFLIAENMNLPKRKGALGTKFHIIRIHSLLTATESAVNYSGGILAFFSEFWSEVGLYSCTNAFQEK